VREKVRPGAAAMRVLVASARLTCATGDATELREAARGVVDWGAVLDLARWHRVVPFVAQALDVHARDDLEPRALAVLRDAAREVAARALAAAGELVRVLGALESAGVRVLPYKGPALALAAYGDSGVRDCVDLDFVVTPAALRHARDTLVALGYGQRHGMSRVQERAIFGGQGHFSYSRGTQLLELHWRFCATRFPWNPPFGEILDRCASVALAGRQVPVPAREDQLLLLLLHGTRHRWAELEWVLAVAMILRTGPFDAGPLLARAGAVGGRRAVLVGIELVRQALGAAVPASVQGEAAADARVAPLVADALGCLVAGRTETPLPRAHARRFHLGCLQRPGDRVRFLAQSALRPTPREWELVRLPGALASLYVPIRIGRLLLRH